MRLRGVRTPPAHAVPFPWEWGNIISSAAGTQTCDIADFITKSRTYGRTFRLPVPFLGPTLNDNVGIIRTWND